MAIEVNSVSGRPRDLLRDPVWRAEELGRPIPHDPHAVSVALPRWQDVVGYEEGRPQVLGRLTSGYPRFVIHPLVRRLALQLAGAGPCLPFPSARVAHRCAAFIRRTSGEAAEVIAGERLHAVRTSEEGRGALKAFWQHTGLIVSSRQAEAVLSGRPSPDAARARAQLRRELAGLYGCDPDDVLLAPSGMAAHDAALQVVRQLRPGLPTAQLGFPYVDTLKLQEKMGDGAILLHDLDCVERDLRAIFARGGLAGSFCEIPGNPLLGSVDLRRVTPLLRARGVPLVVDDVVATPVNIDLGPYADLIATSLTKYAVGTGDAMGGALILNPRSPLYPALQPLAAAQHEELLWGEDAEVIADQVGAFSVRVRVHNRHGESIAERLRGHPAVEQVWYPKWETAEAYEAVRRPEGGWGSLVTFLPKAAQTRAARIYDALAVCKGPSLGTVFTLACPFTLLAHYAELDWAEACGVSRYLIRLSVGLEDPEELWARIEAALGVA